MAEDTWEAVASMNGVGQTARWTAASRARESARPDRLFEDPLAELLAGPDGPELLQRFHTPHASADGNPFLPIRTRWFDDFLADAVAAGFRQFVGLGAGLDTRAFRLDWPDDAVVYEVDQPTVLDYKRTRLAADGARPRCAIRSVGVDLGADWTQALLDAGFDRSEPACWFCEGVLFYLPSVLSARVVRDAAEVSAPGSRFAVDLIGPGVFRLPYMKGFLRTLAEAGSPWQSWVDDPAGHLTGQGWAVDLVTEPGGPAADYGRWPENALSAVIPDLPRSYLVAARRPG